MPGRDEVRAQPFRPTHECCKFQIAVAMDAGNRGAAGGVLADEIGDDRVGELSLEVDDVVRDAELCGYSTGVVKVVNRTATAERACTRLRRVRSCVVVQLHRQPD